ncbi:hypothetical protein [Streptomyces flaveolus]|uniref:hypothetical protein n=1 Tax=Streptomyces flaveolus TaxID=67297 RepID=UPI0037A95B20
MGIPTLPATSSMMDGIGGCHLVSGGGEAAVKQGKLLSPIVQPMAQDRVRLLGMFADLENEWATWQSNDPNSPGWIDASCILVQGPVPKADLDAIVHAPPNITVTVSRWRFVVNREIRQAPGLDGLGSNGGKTSRVAGDEPWTGDDQDHNDRCHARWRASLNRLTAQSGHRDEGYDAQCGGCRFWIASSGQLGRDYGACGSPGSSFDGRVRLEHDGCESFADRADGSFE